MRLENLKSVGERTQKCDRGKPRVVMSGKWYLDLVVKRLRCIDCLNPLGY